ncbi:macro domain-containing protein [Nonomuraea sp. NPDC050790]|uniref:macro domain-containing protein n=1 Tax=Nonomuraea sp. NPDC050790 TaxID=3364371 RepID=UPI00379591D3
MALPYVRLFGNARVEIGAQQIRPRPTTAAVLARLVIADNEPVTVEEIFHDVWAARGPRVQREDRVCVQKRILELRRILDPGRPGESSRILRTERGRVSAYRLVLDHERVDILQFQDLVRRAGQAVPATSLELLTRAIDLWRGRPLFDVADRSFAAPVVSRLVTLRHAARWQMMDAYVHLGLADRALRVGEELSQDSPGNSELSGVLSELRGRLQGGSGGEVLRQDLAGSGASLVIARGDLFAQDDAHLVVGFTDTFDTATDHDLIISRQSVQGQLLHRLYDDDRARLDRELKTALRHVTPEGVETRSAKRRGKLTRYPPGTVAVLHQRGRCVFAVAYSHMGNNLVADSSLDRLELGLDLLWKAVYLHGQRKPVALPLLGSGLARIDGVEREKLLRTITRSFLRSSRSRPFCPELRIVIQPAELGKINMLSVGKMMRETDSVPGR